MSFNFGRDLVSKKKSIYTHSHTHIYHMHTKSSKADWTTHWGQPGQHNETLSNRVEGTEEMDQKIRALVALSENPVSFSSIPMVILASVGIRHA